MGLLVGLQRLNRRMHNELRIDRGSLRLQDLSLFVSADVIR